MMGLTTGAVTGVINRMERMGYARREKDPDDGRRVVVRPVPEELERAGADVFGSYERRALDALVSEYDERDLALFLDFMRKANDMTEEEIARIRAASEGDEEGVFATPLGSVESGRLVFANGASRLTLRADSGMDDLYRASFEGTPPKVEVQDGTVTFRRSRRFQLFDSPQTFRGGHAERRGALGGRSARRGGPDRGGPHGVGAVLLRPQRGDQRPHPHAPGAVGGGPDTSVGGRGQSEHTSSRRGRGAVERERRRQQR